MRSRGFSLVLGCLACTPAALPVPPESERATLLIVEDVYPRRWSHHGYVSLMDLHADGAAGWLNFGTQRPRVAVLSVPGDSYRTRAHGHAAFVDPHFGFGRAVWSCRERLELPARHSATLTVQGQRTARCRIDVQAGQHAPPIAEDAARLTLRFERAKECSSSRSDIYIYYGDPDTSPGMVNAILPGCAIAASYDIRPREWTGATHEVEVVPDCMMDMDSEHTRHVELRRGQEVVLEIDEQYETCA